MFALTKGSDRYETVMGSDLRILSLVTNDHAGFFRQQVSGLRERGHTVDVLAVPGYSKDVERSVVTYVRYYLRSVASSVRGYDLVHANYGLTAPPAVLQMTSPTVLTLWGSDLMGEYGWVSRLCARFVDEVVVMSEQMAEQCGRECHVIPHGIDLNLFRPLPRAFARAEIGWRQSARHVLFPYGTDREVKDFPRAKRIVDRVQSRTDRSVELHTVSGVPHSRMPLYMNAADALVLTSKREGMPNSIKEALACDLPVIATAVSDLPTVLTDVSNSVASDDDAILVETLSSVLRSGERSDGRAVVESLGKETQLDKLEAVYHSACSP